MRKTLIIYDPENISNLHFLTLDKWGWVFIVTEKFKWCSSKHIKNVYKRIRELGWKIKDEN